MIRKNPNGTYSARFGRHGVERTFDRKRDADEYEEAQKKAKRRDRAGMHTDPGAITYAALTELYLDSYAGRSKPWLTSILKHSTRAFGKQYVRSIRPEDVARWMAGLTQAPSTKTHILTTFRTVLALGVEWGYLERSPAASRFITVPGRKRLQEIRPFESWAEVEMVADATPGYRSLIRFVCATGLRPAEWIELRWSDIDVKNKTVHVRGTKTKAANRVVPLSKQALNALEPMARPIRRDAHVFTNATGKPIPLRSWRDTAWTRKLVAAGVDARPPYQMRHTFATLALEAGVPIDAVSKLMGHEGIEITLRYYAKWTKPMLDNARSILDQIGDDEVARRGAEA